MLFSVGRQATVDGLTIVRTRGNMLVRLQVSDGVASGMLFGFGMCVVTENAFGIGITAVPHPLVDEDWNGWFVHWQGQLAGSSLSSEGVSTKRLEIDSKAMRKIKNTDVIIGVMESAGEVGSVTLAIDFISRVLFKLP